MDRTKTAAALFFLGALLSGAIGQQGCSMYQSHNAQHQAADADHQLLLQMTPVVNQLLQIEQKRQQAAAQP